MKRKMILGMLLVFTAALYGCGGDHGPSPVVVDILSAGGAYDGHITYDSVLPEYTVTLSSETPNAVVAGTDPAVAGIQRRGFITFPISSIPPGASVRSAAILLPILWSEAIFPATDVTLYVDMVTFPRLNLLATQTDLYNVYTTTPILAGPAITVPSGFAGADKSFDATDALNEALFRGYSTLQIRLSGSSGEVAVDDLYSPDTGGLTPLLRVEYD